MDDDGDAPGELTGDLAPTPPLADPPADQPAPGPRGRRRRQPGRRRQPRYAGWIPFLCVVAAIIAIASSAVLWVTSPNWGRHGAHATAVRNVGEIPSSAPTVGAAAIVIAPIRIEIPRLGVAAPIVPVGTDNSGALEVPRDPKTVGWWQYGARPGARTGTSILAGHINYAGVTGALADIGTLNPGDDVFVYGFSKGKQQKLHFRITGVRTYDKQGLPFQQIFDQHSIGRIALVTCGGPFDASTGNYLDNIVAFAVPA